MFLMPQINISFLARKYSSCLLILMFLAIGFKASISLFVIQNQLLCFALDNYITHVDGNFHSSIDKNLTNI